MNPPQNIGELAGLFTSIIWGLIPVVMGIAFLIFLWGLVKFISKAGDAKEHAEGRRLMVWGLVGLFVLACFGGIIYFVYNDFGFSRPFGFPTLP